MNGPAERLLRLKPPRISMALLAAAALAQLFVPTAGVRHVQAPEAGLALAATGFVLMLRAWWLFRMHRTAICPTDTSTELITGDVYRWTRNPMYLGITLMMGGLVLWLGTWPMMLAAAAWMWVMDRVFCPFEEAHLEQQFGDRFRDYRARVRRWL